MQHYLDQLDKMNNLLAQQPNDIWTTLGSAMLLALSLLLLIGGLAFLYYAKPISTVVDLGTRHRITYRALFRRVGYIAIGAVLMTVASAIAPTPNAVPAESERNIHNTLMDMNDVDYKTLVDGTNKYQLSNGEQAKYKTIIKIIQKASKVRPVK